MNANPYEELLEYYRETSYLEGANSILGWDQETYMPPGGVQDRALQMATIAAMIHRRTVSNELTSLLKRVKDGGLDGRSGAVYREINRGHRLARALPEEYVRELKKTTSIAQQAWAKARSDHDFASFSPHLSRIIELKKREAEYIGYEDTPYDALLDGFEPNTRTSYVTRIFHDLREKLVPIVKKITTSGVEIEDSFLRRDFPIQKQREVLTDLVTDMGYDLEHGRMDVVTHPFSTGTPRDVRITTRFDEKNIKPALFACIHEAGHALYEQGFLEEHYNTPLGEPVSTSIHESQSRFWENIVGRSLPYWRRNLPTVKRAFGNLDDVTPEMFHKAVNKVEPSYIRVEADEVTYNLHVMLRFEIETEMMDGKIETDEIPQVWNDKFEKYLGIEPPNDALGCLQDIHWSFGYIGYFPTYTLGNLYSAQFTESMISQIGELDHKVESGDLSTVLGWLRKNIHNHGKYYTADELVERITGGPLSENAFISYVKRKYTDIYGITL